RYVPGRLAAVLLARTRQHRAATTNHRRETIRVHERRTDVLRRLRGGGPPHDREVRAEERVEHRVLGTRVAARVPPEPVAALGDHQRVGHALLDLGEWAPLLPPRTHP